LIIEEGDGQGFTIDVDVELADDIGGVIGGCDVEGIGPDEGGRVDLLDDSDLTERGGDPEHEPVAFSDGPPRVVEERMGAGDLRQEEPQQQHDPPSHRESIHRMHARTKPDDGEEGKAVGGYRSPGRFALGGAYGAGAGTGVGAGQGRRSADNSSSMDPSVGSRRGIRPIWVAPSSPSRLHPIWAWRPSAVVTLGADRTSTPSLASRAWIRAAALSASNSCWAVLRSLLLRSSPSVARTESGASTMRVVTSMVTVPSGWTVATGPARTRARRPGAISHPPVTRSPLGGMWALTAAMRRRASGGSVMDGAGTTGWEDFFRGDRRVGGATELADFTAEADEFLVVALGGFEVPFGGVELILLEGEIGGEGIELGLETGVFQLEALKGAVFLEEGDSQTGGQNDGDEERGARR